MHGSGSNTSTMTSLGPGLQFVSLDDPAYRYLSLSRLHRRNEGYNFLGMLWYSEIIMCCLITEGIHRPRPHPYSQPKIRLLKASVFLNIDCFNSSCNDEKKSS